VPTLANPRPKRAVDTAAPDPAHPGRDVFLCDGGDGAVKGFGLHVRAQSEDVRLQL
jgi:hypothetical protein